MILICKLYTIDYYKSLKLYKDDAREVYRILFRFVVFYLAIMTCLCRFDRVGYING